MLEQLLLAFSEYLHSSQFRDLARHPDFPNAFTRDRKLPLHALLAVLLSGMRKGIQASSMSFSPISNSVPNWSAMSPSAPFSVPAPN